jgi:hypothetical protein
MKVVSLIYLFIIVYFVNVELLELTQLKKLNKTCFNLKLEKAFSRRYINISDIDIYIGLLY